MVVDTAIDILTDSVCDIQAKLFYQATDGKTMRNAWEAPMPGALQVLTIGQARAWGSESMMWKAARVARDPRRRGVRKVSAMKHFAQRSAAKPFHGYRSEPPKAKAFKFVDPIGPVATAIKAAGELAAIAEFKGEDDSPVWKLLEGSWGVKIGELKKYVKPDLSGTSEKDIIKFVRSPSHMLYGFNNHAPTVTTSLGRYRPETMPDNYMFDWHSFSLALRYQGEYVARYQGGFPTPNAAGAFAPAYAEGEAFYRTVTTENMASSAKAPHSSAIEKIVDTTMKHYRGEMNRYGVRSQSRFATARASVSSDINIDISVINAMAVGRSKANLHLAKGMKDVVSDSVAYDIKEESSGKFRKSIANNAINHGAHYIPTWISVHALLWEQFFRSAGESAQKIIAILRTENTYLALEQKAQDALKHDFLRQIPKDFGYMLYTILGVKSPSVHHATLQFLAMVSVFTGMAYTVPDKSWSDIYYEAINNSVSFKDVIRYVRMGFRSFQSHIHSAGNIIMPNTPGLSIAQNFTIGMSNFSHERLAYWRNHYYSRVEEYRFTLDRLSGEGKSRGLDWGNVNDGYPNVRDMQVDVGQMTDDQIIEYHKGCRYGVVAYAFLAKCYTASSVAVDERLNVNVSIRIGAYAKIMNDIARSYAKKRSSRRANGEGYDIDEICSAMSRMTRHTDINNHFDNALGPAVKWSALYAIYVEKANVTSNSVTKTLRVRISGCNEKIAAVAKEVTQDMALAVAAPQPYEPVASSNPYGELYESDTDSEDGKIPANYDDAKVTDKAVDVVSRIIETPVHDSVNTTNDVAGNVTNTEFFNDFVYVNSNADAVASFADAFETDELFEEDDDDFVDYRHVSLRNYVANSQTAVFDHETFDMFIVNNYNTVTDITLRIDELADATAQYNIMYSERFPPINNGIAEADGNVDII